MEDSVKRSVERVRYVINNLLHLVIMKYGDISLVLCISTRLRLVTILLLLMKYLAIFHADPCNKSYLFYTISLFHFLTVNCEKQVELRSDWSEAVKYRINCISSLYVSCSGLN